MIDIIEYGIRTYLKFINSSGKTIIIGSSILNSFGYCVILGYIKINNGLIISLESYNKESLEKKRRNVFKFDENGQIVWQIQDHFDYWNSHPIKNQEEFLKNFEEYGYSLYQDNDGKIIGDIGVYQFEINPDNGHITLMEPTIWR